jgi:curli production assembly/transport component CsgF
MTDRVVQHSRRVNLGEVTAMRKISIRMVCLASVVGFLTPALATEQVYHPVSPALGGSPNNGAFLLSTAQAQGEGVRSGNQGPDLSGLTNALGGIGNGTTPPTGGNGTGGTGTGGGGTPGGGQPGTMLANPSANVSRMP